jgi:MULE transposase domain
MAWQAKPEYAEHHRAVIERMVNAFPPEWLLPPYTGEIFNSLEYYNRRLKAFSLAEGFDIVRKGGGTRANPSYRFSYYYHGKKTRNDRNLEESIKYDEKSKISSNR